MTINIVVKATVDFGKLCSALEHIDEKASRCQMADATATLELDCGCFSCGDLPTVLEFAKEWVRIKRAVAIELDWSKSPW